MLDVDEPRLIAALSAVVLHGGTCHVSRLARGTQVSLTLPQSQYGDRGVIAAGRD